MRNGRETAWPPEAQLTGVEDQGEKDGYRQLVLRTARGPVHARLYGTPGAQAAAIMVGGVGGGFASPARGLYARMCQRLCSEGIAALRVRFRDPRQVREAAHDVLAGVRVLGEAGVSRVGLVGHSFGGAVVITAGAVAEEVVTVVALSSQSYGADQAANLAPRSLLLVHGTADEVLPPACSRYIHELARPPKRLHLLRGARHGLDEAREEVYTIVTEWLVQELAL